jgi:hypothetical protein
VFHGDLFLIQNLFVPSDIEVIFLALPYNGGRFANSGLRVVEHLQSDATQSLELLALAHRPSLSAAEKAALANVPAEQSGLNIGNPIGPIACGVGLFLAAAAVEVAVVAVTFAITGKVDIEHMEHVSPAEIKKLGPAASARELVRMRSEFLANRKTVHRAGKKASH